jgi:hypothetical protein
MGELSWIFEASTIRRQLENKIVTALLPEQSRPLKQS